MKQYLNQHRLFLLVLFVSVVGCYKGMGQSNPSWKNILDFGATAEKEVVSTKFIQAAIDSCYHQGGGTVYFPPGDYLSGTLILKDYVTLHLESGATLWASRNIDHYKAPLIDAIKPMLLYANGAKNIAIEGGGTIHVQAERVYEDLRNTDRFIKEETENARKAGVEMKQYYHVPPAVGLLTFADCENIKVEDVALIESSFWCLHIIRSRHIFIRGVSIRSSLEAGINSDGIDINSCQDVVISDCLISTGDDAIVMKSWYDQPCENITVSNCVLESSSTALKLGTETKGDMRHIVFNNCAIRNSNRGLSIVMRDGGTVEDVVFSNITIECSRRHFNWWGNGDPIWIYLTKRYPNSKVGTIRNVVFDNVIARGMGTSKIESTEGKNIHNIRLKNVQLHMEAESKPDKRADHGFYTNGVVGLRMVGCRITWDQEKTEPKWASAVFLENTDEVLIDGLEAVPGQKDPAYPVVNLQSVTQAIIRNCRALEEVGLFVKVEGKESALIQLENNNPFQKAKSLLRIGSDVQQPNSIQTKP
ncbi:MAG: glycoside hydrolase family 28 protein [Salibacteraceae bacterium]